MSKCIEKINHDCGSSDGLQVFEEDGAYSGFCFACRTYIPDPYGDNPPTKQHPVQVKTPAQIQAELDIISTYPVANLHDRHLNKQTLEHFGVKVGLSEQDGSTITSHFYPYRTDNGPISGYKCRIVEGKVMFTIGSTKGADLFGWREAITSGSKRLYITEGEIDAMTVWQVLMRKIKEGPEQYRHQVPAVVSLVNGSSSARKGLTENATAIRNSFKEVVLVFDQDEAGEKATADAIKSYPKATSVVVPGKDPNDCLVSGHKDALWKALVFQAAKPKNTRIRNIRDFIEDVKLPVKRGLSMPFEKLDQMTRGLRWSEVYYLGAGVKMGKSDLLNALAVWFMTEHKLHILVAKPEEALKHTSKHMYGKAVGKIMYDADIPINPDDVDEADLLLEDRCHVIEQYQELQWAVLKQDIEEAINEFGVKIVFIDPITNLTLGMGSSDVNTMLGAIAQDIAMLAKEREIAVFMFCHLKSPDSGDSHERGGRVMSHQFTGSRSMMRSCQYMLGLQGNKAPELPLEQQNMRQLVMLEDRQHGSSGVVNLYWDHKTGLFNEIKEES